MSTPWLMTVVFLNTTESGGSNSTVPWIIVIVCLVGYCLANELIAWMQRRGLSKIEKSVQEHKLVSAIEGLTDRGIVLSAGMKDLSVVIDKHNEGFSRMEKSFYLSKASEAMEERRYEAVISLAGRSKELADKIPDKEFLDAALKDIGGFVAGLEAMCKVTSERTDALNRAVDTLQSTLTPGGSAGDYSVFAEDTPEARRLAEQLETAELVRRGITSEDARARVKERNIYHGLGR